MVQLILWSNCDLGSKLRQRPSLIPLMPTSSGILARLRRESNCRSAKLVGVTQSHRQGLVLRCVRRPLLTLIDVTRHTQPRCTYDIGHRRLRAIIIGEQETAEERPPQKPRRHHTTPIRKRHFRLLLQLERRFSDRPQVDRFSVESAHPPAPPSSRSAAATSQAVTAVRCAAAAVWQARSMIRRARRG